MQHSTRWIYTLTNNGYPTYIGVATPLNKLLSLACIGKQPHICGTQLHTSGVRNLATVSMKISNSKVYNLTTLDMQLSRMVHVGVEKVIQRLGHCLSLPPYALIGASRFTGVHGRWSGSVFNMVRGTIFMHKY
jgi:hypothetical protein